MTAMKKPLLVFALFAFLLVVGCASVPGQKPAAKLASGQTGFFFSDDETIPKFSYACKDCQTFDDCQDSEAYCRARGLRNISYLADHSMSIFPQKALVCNYACASEKVFSRIDAKRQERTTASCKGGDEYIHIGQDGVELALTIWENRIDGQFAIPASAADFFADLSGDFSGQAEVTIWVDRVGGEWGAVESFPTPPAGTKLSNGVITIHYTMKEGGKLKSKSFDVICTGTIRVLPSR